jgi:hypothetical protein
MPSYFPHPPSHVRERRVKRVPRELLITSVGAANVL